jgi:prepilin-type N-terminal cleavage/methylation domain-containing protein
MSGRGFTLIEVLVALILISISLGAVFQAFSQSKNISWRSDEKMECSRIAHNILADSALMEAALDDEEISGNVEGESGWRYSMTVQPLLIELEDKVKPVEIPSMLNLKLSLFHRVGEKEREFELERWYRR